jgi:hypothetical protein
MKRLFLRLAAAFFAREADMKFVVGANTTGVDAVMLLSAVTTGVQLARITSGAPAGRRRTSMRTFSPSSSLWSAVPGGCLKGVRLLGSLSGPSINLGHTACVLRVRRQRRCRSAASKCHDLCRFTAESASALLTVETALIVKCIIANGFD